MQLFQPNNFFRIMLIVDYVNYIINYAISFDHIIDYAINIIDYVSNTRSTLSNSKVSLACITNYVNRIFEYVEIKMFNFNDTRFTMIT